jgi:hypothetical protein
VLAFRRHLLENLVGELGAGSGSAVRVPVGNRVSFTAEKRLGAGAHSHHMLSAGSARRERCQRGSGRPLVVLLPGWPDGTPERVHRRRHLDRSGVDSNNARAGVVRSLDDCTLEEMSLGCVEQGVRREDLIASSRDPSLGYDHAYNVDGRNSSQSLRDGSARRLCDRVDDSFRRSPFGYRVIGLARQ